MSKTSNVFARVEPELKEQAEAVLNQIGLPMSNAITLFLRQVVLQRGMPFPVALPQKPRSLEDMSMAELDAKLEAGRADIEAGRYRPAEEVFDKLEQRHTQRYGE